MRRTVGLAVTAMAVVVASAALAVSAFGRTSLPVSATVPWSFGGLYVEEGTSYHVEARGFAQTAAIPAWHIPGVFKSASGPAGQPGQPCLAAFESDLNGQCAVEGANFGALVGITIDGDTGMATAAPFVIGADPSFEAPGSGWLFLAVNDLDLSYFDNNGQFTVAITGP